MVKIRYLNAILLSYGIFRLSSCLCYFPDIRTGCGDPCGADLHSISSPCSLLASPHRYGFHSANVKIFRSELTISIITQVWQLILLQGVGVGMGGGLVYMPVIKLLPEWFSERRGLAGGIIFAGTGVGGEL